MNVVLTMEEITMILFVRTLSKFNISTITVVRLKTTHALMLIIRGGESFEFWMEGLRKLTKTNESTGLSTKTTTYGV